MTIGSKSEQKSTRCPDDQYRSAIKWRTCTRAVSILRGDPAHRQSTSFLFYPHHQPSDVPGHLPRFFPVPELAALRDVFTPPGPILLALSIGIGGALFFNLIDAPVPWLLGSLSATLIASIAGLRLTMPRPIRNLGMMILGTAVGSGFKPEIFALASQWIPSVCAMIVIISLITPVSYLIFRRLAKWTPNTAMLAAIPGGFGAMLLIAEESGANLRAVSMAHMFRIITVILSMPLILQWIGGSELDVTAVATFSGEPLQGARDWMVIVACVAVGPYVGRWLRLPASVFMGAMVVSGIVYLTGTVEGNLPRPVVSAVQVVTGTWLGCSFSGQNRRELFSVAAVSLVVTICTLVPVLLAALAFAQYTRFDAMPLLLAFAPGGMPEMSLIALALNLDPTFVIFHHLLRMGALTVFGPLLLRPFLTRNAPREN